MNQTERIIDFVKENTFLYDCRHPMYKDSRAKDRKWKESAAIVNTDCKYKVFNTI